MVDDALLARCAAAVAGHYEIEAEVGRGGMAVVYRARDLRLRRKVALKVLSPELTFHDGVQKRFLREAEMAAGLSHPHIVPIYAVDEKDGLVWMTMGLVDGASLAERLHHDPRPPLDVVRRVLSEVCDALHYAHREGVVHRDIKPDNILLERETGRALVTDFGIARAAEGNERLTATGIAVGTPAYMSPEQAMGERKVDGRADIYALGVVAYQMLAGELPFQASNAPAMLIKHLSERPRPLRDARADLPDNLISAVERALSKGRHERWKDASEFKTALAEDAERPTPRPRRSGSVAVVEPPAHDALAEGKEALRQWREEARKWRDQVRSQPRAQGDDLRAGAQRIAEVELMRRTPEARILSVRKRIGAAVATVGFLAVINAVTSPMFPWVIFPAIGIGYGVVKRITDLWADGIPLRAIFKRSPPRTARGNNAPLRRLEPALPAPTGVTADHALREAVPADVLAGLQGQAIRDAYDARSKIRSVLARLPEGDRALLPEIEPTVEALIERVRTLAIALHALDSEASPEALVRLETRIAQAEAVPGDSADRERRLELLHRQRATLTDLAQRRASLSSQLEQGVLVLETMKLDLAKLRSSGVASRAAGEGPQTEELRALAREVEHAAEAVDEARLDRDPLDRDPLDRDP